MSSILSSLVVVLFCISSHLCKCNARSFGVLHKDMAEKIRPLITKENNDEKLNPSRVFSQPQKEYPTPNATEDAKEESINEKEKIINGESLDEPRKPIQSTSKSDTTKGESLSYVSWRVPHKKRGEQEPGFNLDYLPPKTHPPVHN